MDETNNNTTWQNQELRAQFPQDGNNYQYPQGNNFNYENNPTNRPQKRFWMFLVIMISLIVVLVIVISLVGLFYTKTQDNKINDIGKIAINNEQMGAERILAEKKDRPYIGNSNASLVIVEFSDFQCEKSQQESNQIRQAILSNKDDVLFIHRNFPVIDENSIILAKAGSCANDQGKFWQFHDRLFANQQYLISVENINELAKLSGIDMQVFSACLSSDKYKKILEEDINDARNLGVIGTPTFFVNGNKLEGVIKFEDWQSIINKFLEIKKS